jgi:transcriptional regulator with XRE-family HTH domain
VNVVETVGERIKKLRKKKGLTQAQLAARVNVSPQVISNWERGYSGLDHDDVARLADALDESADFILSGKRESSLEKKDTTDELTSIMFHKWDKLDEKRRKQALKLIEILEQEADEENNKK